MGLAGVKNRSKIGNDPNNTKWARNTNNYGQRILRQQGWEAGQYLGQKDAAHSELYTAASASHIKAVLRADNLGIGAAGPGANTANQCTGLDIFKDLLGRLNGKSEESIEEQRQVRETAKMTLYVQQRFGPMRFVRGGLLVGDQIKEEDSSDSETATPPAASSSESVESATSAASAESVSGDAETDDSKAARKKAKKEKKERKEREKAEKKEKKEKKEKSKKRKADSDDDDDDEPASDDDKAEKKSKKEKKEKKNKKDKSEKKDKKEKKEKDKDKKEKKEKKDKSDKKDKKRRRLDESGASASDDTEDAAPEQPAAAKPVLVSSRHLARRRYINQKRAAVSDPEAIKQIFMIKA